MNPIPQSDLIIGHQTHAGETGKNNEDRALLLAYKGLPEETGDVTLAVIADGIGGHRAGEVASQIAINTFTALFNQTDSRAYLDLFTRAFASIQQAITKHIAENAEAEGMGTTCSVVVIANRRLYSAFIGDSRIYLIRNNSIRQISVDHTWVQEAIEHGVLSRQEARKHPNRHVVRRHLGAAADVTPDFRIQLTDSESPSDARRNQGLSLKSGDIVLLSSDGMTDLVEDHEILAAFDNQHTPQAAVESLVMLARQRGGFDNITITALKLPNLPQPAAAAKPASSKVAPAFLGTLLLGAIGLALVLSLALFAYFIFTGTLFQTTPTPLNPNPTITSTPFLLTTPTPQLATLQPDTPTALPTATRTGRPSPTVDLTSPWLTITAESAAQQTAIAATPTP